MSTDTLKHNIAKLAMDMHAVVTDSNLTVAERQEKYEAMDTDLKKHQQEYADAVWLEERSNALTSLMGPDPAAVTDTPKAPSAKSIGEQVVNSAAFKAVSDQIKLGGQFRSGPIEIMNATLTAGGVGVDVIAPQRQPGIMPILFQRLTVADLMPNGTTSAPIVRYVEETTATNAASTVAEGGTKPEATLDFDTVDEPVRKIAVTLKVTDEMLEDMDGLQSYLDARLTLFVRIREEQQLLTGAGTGNDLDGLLNRSITAADPVGSETYGKIALAVHRELTKIRVASFLEPDGIVFHPNDWQAARFEADANGQFFGGGPFVGQYGNGSIAGDTYWNLRVVSTTAMTENTILMGAFSTAAQIFRRNGLTVDMTNSDQDDFIKNLVTLRAEERLALAVYRPAAFGTVTGA